MLVAVNPVGEVKVTVGVVVPRMSAPSLKTSTILPFAATFPLFEKVTDAVVVVAAVVSA